MNEITMKMNADELILSALREDIPSEDVTTNSVMKDHVEGTCDLIAKEDGILCGAEVFKRVFILLDENTEVVFLNGLHDGSAIKKGDIIASLKGDIRVLLSGERTALNYLQRMSGIATYTKKVVDALGDPSIKVLDTRKTTPNMRIFEKYAVRIGGGHNHRNDLSDGVLLKDNHIGAAGGVKEAILAAKAYAPFVRKIEVETESIDMVKDALSAGADIIMLDNMSLDEMKEAIALIGGKAEVELSGNFTLENIERIRGIGADFVSCGALTHSAPILDLSLKHLKKTGD